jgi:hypothetical protein
MTGEDVKHGIEIGIAAALILFPFAILVYRAKTGSQGFSRGTIKFTGAVMLSLLIVVLAFAEAIDRAVIATLIGGIAGYLLSSDDKDD